jgi:hypothetical protein
MAIFVVCPGCRKRFEVSDQFAGKTGPCPHCKTTIKIPEKSDEVVVHGPAPTPPGKSRGTVASFKPIARKDTKFRPLVAAIVVAAVVAAVLVAIFARSILREYWVARAVGLLLVTPPLLFGGYSILRDDELEPYRGRSLYLRVAALTAAYLVLWGVFGQVEGRVLTGEVWQWLIAAPPFFVIGALAAYAALDLEFGSGVLLYGFYVLVSILLRWLAGMGWIWQAGGSA